MQLKCVPPRTENHIRIPFAFIGQKGLRISRIYGIYRFYFCGRSLGETASTSLFLFFFFSVRCASWVSDYCYRFSDFPNDRLTQCWKLARETRKKREKKTWDWAEAAFYDELYDFSFTRRLSRLRDREIDETSMHGRSSRKYKRCLLWNKPQLLP